MSLTTQDLEEGIFVPRSFDGGEVRIIVHHGSVVRGRGMNVKDTDFTSLQSDGSIKYQTLVSLSTGFVDFTVNTRPLIFIPVLVIFRGIGIFWLGDPDRHGAKVSADGHGTYDQVV